MKLKSVIILAIIVLFPLAVQAQSAREYIDQGITKATSGNLKGALSDFNKAIEKDPKSAEAYYSRAITKASMGDKKGALSDFDRSIELKDKSAYTLELLSSAL